jgi:hypothetical protein
MCVYVPSCPHLFARILSSAPTLQMFLSRNFLRFASAAIPRRLFAIDAAQHPVSPAREPSARVTKLAEVRGSSFAAQPPNKRTEIQ